MRYFYHSLLLGMALWPCSQPSQPVTASRSHALTPGPLIKQVDSVTFRLLLPSSMATLLADSAPGFQLWPWLHYHPDVRNWYVLSHRTAPSAVIGDFNGDGVQDVVMDGHDRTRVLRLCLLSQDDGFTFLVLQNYAWDSTAGDRHDDISFLAFRSPGHVGPNVDDQEMVLRTDAFEGVAFEKASTLYYWNGKTFVEFQTSD